MIGKSRHQLRAEWAADCRRVADRWFGGDTAQAGRVLDALPYSKIPDWSDVDAVMSATTSTPGRHSVNWED
ncbi:hypothetical protein DS6A_40 [Mycobacterium phage DS6A]|uniref:Uncharacterized protein n=1 Tax=Mycobacterium phage DS6A TaxID=45764 RepID=G8I4F0_9CAUD|nr:hypothetical protein DS6A_40 [Mycobacterium phage DS6A]AER47594.1 hypothetical protein DS6A_40 [Mycobacterium phage DS6A]